ncbi:pentapeptide repeat-containing protein [Microseira sp. BLCC-F43]|jgi:uncharacterized protein YjbI with pentapeptide repeats|uniref:pentapeptide repeat-containing protein n=1 Tax=Microseira sp. BLCC-F43 TaxID=3153602 RepID=UPI0035B7082C
MKSKNLVIAGVLAAIVVASPSVAQNQEIDRELYQLCTQFPLNSRCAGFNIPIPLDARKGEQAACGFNTGKKRQSGKCKIAATAQGLTLYIEEGKELDFLDNKRGTAVVNVPLDRVFAINYRQWNRIHRVELGFLIQSESSRSNRTNFLEIISNEKLAMSLKSQLKMPPISPEMLSVGKVRVETTESGSDPSALVKQLLETKECLRCNLPGANLSSADLKAVNLAGANLQGAKLEGAYLVGANLDKANLTEANLKRVNLALGSVQEAVLQNADLRGVNLQGASLPRANLQGAKLSAPAMLQNADLSNTNLKNANLEGAMLAFANLEGADLQGADLGDTSVKLSGIPGNYSRGEMALDAFGTALSILTGNLGGIAAFNSRERPVKFDTNLQGANLKNANLTGVCISRQNI